MPPPHKRIALSGEGYGSERFPAVSRSTRITKRTADCGHPGADNSLKGIPTKDWQHGKTATGSNPRRIGSSIGRASASEAEGCRFDPCLIHKNGSGKPLRDSVLKDSHEISRPRKRTTKRATLGGFDSLPRSKARLGKALTETWEDRPKVGKPRKD